MLDDEVVPVDNPDVAVGADFGERSARSIIVARRQVPGVVRQEVGAVGCEREGCGQVPGRLGDEGRPVPVVTSGKVLAV